MSEFELIPDIAERIKRSKMELQDSGLYWAPEWDSQSCCDQDYVNNFKKGWDARQSEIDQLKEMNQRYIGKMQEQQDMIAELKDRVATYKIETYESHGRLNCVEHYFSNMSRDQFCENIKAILYGSLRHPELSFDKKRIRALRGEHEN